MCLTKFKIESSSQNSSSKTGNVSVTHLHQVFHKTNVKFHHLKLNKAHGTSFVSAQTGLVLV